jgi:hypothetical protein
MFTRKNKGGNIIRNKKTRKGSLQKGGGLKPEEKKTYYETLISIIYDSDIEIKFGGADALLDSLKKTKKYTKDDQNAIITFLKESLDLINQYDKIYLYNHADIQNSLSSDDKDRIKLLLNAKYATSITNLKEQVNRVFSQIIFKYSGELTNDKTLLYMLLNELTIYNNNNINKGFDKTEFSNFLTKNNQTTTVVKSDEKKPISDLNIFPPDNSQNSCWLNSILMALMVPAYLDENKEENTLTKIKQFEKFKTYIDSYLTTNVKRIHGTQALQEIKESIFYENNSIKNQFHNVDSFLEHSLFNTYFNSKMTIEKTVYDIKEESNKDTLNIPLHESEQKFTIIFSREETVKYTDRDDKIIFSIDKNEIHKSYQYEIKTNLKYLIFQCDGEGDFTESLEQLFLKETLKIGTKTYKRVSFVLASGGHYVSVVKKNNLYYLINDLPPTITLFYKANVKNMISKRSTKIETYYYLNVIVYMLDEVPSLIDKQKEVTIENEKDSLKVAVNSEIESQKEEVSIESQKEEASIESQKDQLKDSLKVAVNSAMMTQKEEASIEIQKDKLEDSLKEAANAAIKTQKEEASIETQKEPTQSVKTYIIQFDATGKVIVTDQVQKPEQFLSEEIEDHYFKEKTEYKPIETKQYTVTVTTDPESNKTIIKI